MPTSDIILLSVSALLQVIGIAGSVLPMLPGAPLSFVGMVLCTIVFPHPLMITLTVVLGIMVLISMVIDYIAPTILTDKAGGSKYAMWGTNIGLIAGLIFFGPIGVILGPFVGAFVGEVIYTKKAGHSVKIAAYSFLSFIIGTMFKLMLCLIMFCICAGCVIISYIK
ncbi:MAG: DUF456 domain-containing protein [Bacteroidaceae bacterium]|nr:DUF456 domain-containing protein [Bacteroidaceae bacterium]